MGIVATLRRYLFLISHSLIENKTSTFFGVYFRLQQGSLSSFFLKKKDKTIITQSVVEREPKKASKLFKFSPVELVAFVSYSRFFLAHIPTKVMCHITRQGSYGQTDDTNLAS